MRALPCLVPSTVVLLALLAPACAVEQGATDPLLPPSSALSFRATPKNDCDNSYSFTEVEDASSTIQGYAEHVGVLRGRDDVTSGNLAGEELCSVTLIGPSVALTAGHCLDVALLEDHGFVFPTGVDTPEELCELLDVRFNYQLDGGNVPPTSEMPSFHCASIVEQTNGTVDYAVVTLDGEPGATWGYQELAVRPPVVDEDVTLIGHPDGVPMVVSVGIVLEATDGGGIFSYEADTLGGSSGAGVLDDDGHVIGVHTNGDCDADDPSVNRNMGYDLLSLRTQGDFIDEVDYFEQRDIATDEAGDRFGDAVAGGDFDGDGADDVAVGVPYETPGGSTRTASGWVLVRYGAVGQGADPARQAGFAQTGGSTGETNDMFGDVLAVGDFNGDGYDDLAVGVPYEDLSTSSNAGMVNIHYGSSSGLATTSTSYATAPRGGGAYSANAYFGSALAVGDFDNDGYADLGIGAWGETSQRGAVYVFRGGSTGLATSGTRMTQATTTRETDESGDRFGFTLASGDFNGDGYDDLAAGAPRETTGTRTNAGHVIAACGSASGISPTLSVGFFQGSPDSVEARDYFGTALSAGDFNNDGYADLAIGVPGEDWSSSTTDVGQVNVAWGSSATLGTSFTRYWPSDVNNSVESGDQLGEALIAGDVNEDGYADLIVGTPREDLDTTTDGGWVTVQLGRSTGLSYWGSISQSLVADIAASDNFGMTFTLADTDGDGRNEVVVGWPYQDTPGGDNGGAVVIREVR